MWWMNGRFRSVTMYYRKEFLGCDEGSEERNNGAIYRWNSR